MIKININLLNDLNKPIKLSDRTAGSVGHQLGSHGRAIARVVDPVWNQLPLASGRGPIAGLFSSYTEVYSVIYDSGSVPE